MLAAASRCFAALALMLFCLSQALSRDGTSLYTGQVPVNSQAEGERAEALKSALAQVVIKLSGDSTALTRPGVAKAIASAERYMQQYQYSQEAVSEAGQPQTRLYLVAQFDHDAVDQLMRDLDLVHGGGDSTAQPAAEMQSGTYRVWVSGVNSAEDYARLIGSLSRNELVRSVRAEQARGDGVQLKLDVNGPLPRLLDSLSQGPVHVLNAKPPVDGVDALLGMQQQ